MSLSLIPQVMLLYGDEFAPFNEKKRESIRPRELGPPMEDLSLVDKTWQKIYGRFDKELDKEIARFNSMLNS